jgi:6-phosphogluconate dehydrogenase (decarboxylating)
MSDTLKSEVKAFGTSEKSSEERKKSDRRKSGSESKLINFLASRPKWMWIMVTATLGMYIIN